VITAKVANLRFHKAPLRSGFDFKSLNYLSVHHLDNKDEANYGKQRLDLHMTHAWLDKKFEFGGIKFDDVGVQLTESELNKISLSEAATSLDSVQFEAIVRHNSHFIIHPDEAKFWHSQSSKHQEEFVQINTAFEENHSKILETLISTGFGGVGEVPQQNGSEVVLQVDDDDDAPADHDKPEEFQSFEELDGADKIQIRAATEIGDVEFLGGASGHTYLMSKT
jgi:hypothetical protein